MYSRSDCEGTSALDKEYSPSRHTKRFHDDAAPHQRVIENYVEVSKEETRRVRAKYNVLENVRYAQAAAAVAGDNRFVDIYFKEAEYGTPIFVFVHGGYWQLLSRSEAGSFVAPYVERGYRVVVADYNLCPAVTLAELAKQTSQFFNWVFEYAAKTNTTSIEFCGHSAGAHLLTFLLAAAPQLQRSSAIALKNIYLVSGIYDLRELWQLESTNANNVLSLDAKIAEDLSPMCWNMDAGVGGKECKIHVLVAANDSSTFIRQSEVYAEKLSKAGFHATFKLFDRYDHFDIIEDVANDKSPINLYFMENSKQ